MEDLPGLFSSLLGRMREPMSSLPTEGHIHRRAAEGWRLVAVEWARGMKKESAGAERSREEIP